jgi:hypothetical protein
MSESSSAVAACLGPSRPNCSASCTAELGSSVLGWATGSTSACCWRSTTPCRGRSPNASGAATSVELAAESIFSARAASRLPRTKPSTLVRSSRVMALPKLARSAILSGLSAASSCSGSQCVRRVRCCETCAA